MPQDTIEERTRARKLKELQEESQAAGGSRLANLDIQKLQSPVAFDKEGKIIPGKRAPKRRKVSKILSDRAAALLAAQKEAEEN